MKCSSSIAALTAVVFTSSPALAAAPPAPPPEPVLAAPLLAAASPDDPVLAQAQQAEGLALNAKPDAGGLTPCLLTCYLGPRVGAEYNEGRGIATIEWVSLFFFPARIVPALQARKGKTMTEWARETQIDSRPIPPPKAGETTEKGGTKACLIGFCLGPRVAFERNEGRRVRTREILLFVPVVNVIAAVLMGLESYNGKTMSQIAQDEGLDS